MGDLTKKDIVDIIKQQNEKLLRSRELELRVKDISSKVIVELYKLLWMRRDFWANNINK
jgi:hypothetical protein